MSFYKIFQNNSAQIIKINNIKIKLFAYKHKKYLANILCNIK